ncbi:MAG: dihydrofolate reductase [Sediminibacterium sp.]|jgi:dihydrofolate reductase|nr:dihydrofolate reductase [Hydrotalea sp.]MCU0338030.1 dihydrofolate reductase [Sediminibacterium sp.]
MDFVELIQIVAASNNYAIGKDNQLLWHLPRDLQFFKQQTWAMPVLMGRKTFESVGSKPLPGRVNIILTRQVGLELGEGIIVVQSLDHAIQYCKKHNYRQLFIAGGGEIYQQTFKESHTIFFTRVDTTIEADTFYPAIDPNEWWLLEEQVYPSDEKNGYSMRFEKWKRK